MWRPHNQTRPPVIRHHPLPSPPSHLMTRRAKPTLSSSCPPMCPDLTPARWISWCLSWRTCCRAPISAWLWLTPPSTSSAIYWTPLQRHWRAPTSGFVRILCHDLFICVIVWCQLSHFWTVACLCSCILCPAGGFSPWVLFGGEKRSLFCRHVLPIFCFPE